MTKWIAILFTSLLPITVQAQLLELHDADMAEVRGQQQPDSTSLSAENVGGLMALDSQGEVPKAAVATQVPPEVNRSGISIEVSFLLTIGSIEYTDTDGWVAPSF